MASALAFAGPSRYNLLLPSVLAPKRHSASMSIPDAIEHMHKQLWIHKSNHPKPRRVTIVLYEPKGSPIIHVGNHDECMIYDHTMLEDLVDYVQKTLDVRTSTARYVSGQTSQGYDKLLVSSLEFRVGGPNYPPVTGKLVGGAVNDLKPWGFEYAGVVWPDQASAEYLYFEMYREVLMMGINVTMNRPILKVKTVYRASVDTAYNIRLAGHHFSHADDYYGDDGGTGGGEYLGRKGKAPAGVVDENEIGKGTNHPGGYSAQFAETLWNKKPADMAWDAPEFKLLGLYMESMKNNPSVKLDLVYALHMFSGEKPINALVPKRKEGHGSTRPKEYVWVGPDHPDYPDGADDSITVKARSESEPEDMMKDSEYQSLIEVQLHKLAQVKYHKEKKIDAIGFEDVDDETYFPAAGKSASVKVTPESLDKVNKNSRSLLRVRNNSRVEKTTAMNMKVLTQFQQTVASSRGTSPVRAFTSLYDTPTPSPKTGPGIIKLSTNTQVLQHGVPHVDSARSSLKQSTPGVRQLRPESPAFTFDANNRLVAEVPAVSSLLRLMQIEGVRTARTHEGHQSPLSNTATPNPMTHQSTIDQQHVFGSGKSVLLPAYHSHDAPFSPQSQTAGASMAASMSSGQPHSQNPVNSSTSSPFYQKFRSPVHQIATSMASQTQNLLNNITQRPVRAPVGRHRQPHQTLQAPRPTLPGTPRFPQTQLHQQTNHNYFQTPPAGPASMSSTHVSAAHTPSQRANTPNATVFSYPPLAHPQPKVSANVASAFSIYQSKMDGQSQGGAKDTSDEPASGQQQNPFPFTFSS